MSENCTTGTWRPKPGHVRESVAAWTAFAGWASGMPGAGSLRLARDAGDPERFVSFGVWQREDAVRAWKSLSEFRERIGRVVEHVDVFEPTELAIVAIAASDAATTGTPVAWTPATAGSAQHLPSGAAETCRSALRERCTGERR